MSAVSSSPESLGDAGLLSAEDAKALLALCRAGKLYEIQRWIASGKSVETSAQFKKTPLFAAIDLGFHSLVELLARHERSTKIKNEALPAAVSERRLDLVELLLSQGADIKSIRLDEVLLTWEPSLIRFFLDNGADVITGAPFAIAFSEKIRTALVHLLRTSDRTRNSRSNCRTKPIVPCGISVPRET